MFKRIRPCIDLKQVLLCRFLQFLVGKAFKTIGPLITIWLQKVVNYGVNICSLLYKFLNVVGQKLLECGNQGID
uniref:Candidate secreted effector n=1 Tax=Meloidogyne incognita TaxID=6306 RepID=A0A914MJ55_MELIC